MKQSKTLTTLTSGIATTFGIASIFVSPSELLNASARLLLSADKNNFLIKFKNEFDKIKVKIGFDEKRVNDENPKSIFSSILKELDNNPDENKKLELMKSLYLKSILSNKNSADDLLIHEIIQRVKKMTSMDIVIVECIYTVFIKEEVEYRDISDRGDWQRIISEELGWSPAMNYFVAESDFNLTKLGILTDGRGTDKTIISGHTNFRLSDLGYKMCTYVYSSNE